MTGIRQADGRVTGVDTAAGAIRAEFVVNCAGLWAREVGRMAGVNVPLLAAEHFYVVTDASPDIPRNLPVLRVPDECAYVKEEAGKLLVGFFEPRGKPLPDDKIPDDSEFLTLPDDWEHLARELELASERLPILKRIGLHTFFNGPESFTPDGRWILGEAPSLRNFFVAAGFNSIGIQTAGGVGMAIAEWMEAGEPTLRPHGLRHPPLPALPGQRAPTSPTASARRSACTMPTSSPIAVPMSARGVRTTPLHERLAERGACFTEAAGWERAAWFLPEAARARGEKAEWRYGWGRQPWFDHVAAEHKAVRTGVGLFDLSTFGKIRVEGRDARGRAAAHLRQRCRRGARPHRLYAMAQPQRRRRGRRHGLAALGRRVPGRHAHGERAARPRLAEAPHPRRCPLRGHRRDRRRRPASA